MSTLETGHAEAPFRLIVDDERKAFRVDIKNLRYAAELSPFVLNRKTCHISGVRSDSVFRQRSETQESNVNRRSWFKPSADSMHPKLNIWAVLGVLRFNGDAYLIVVTECTAAAVIDTKAIFFVTKVKLLAFSNPFQCEEQYKDSKTMDTLNSFALYLETQGFYFALNYDLTHTCQRIATLDPTLSISQRADPRFFWNSALWEDFSRANRHDWITPLMQGFVGYERLWLNNKEATLVVINRRSTERVGERVGERDTAKGLRGDGQVAAFVETEQIACFGKQTCSVVMLRCSPPLVWDYRVGTRRQIQISATTTTLPVAKVFLKKLMKCYYTSVALVNLLNEASASELEVHRAYNELFRGIEESDAPLARQCTYLHFDFKKNSKGKLFDPIHKLLCSHVNKKAEEFGYFSHSAESGSSDSSQKGVYVTSCLDGLDASTVTQASVALSALHKQMQFFGLQGNLTDDMVQSFSLLWEAAGDSLCRQETGAASQSAFFKLEQRGALKSIMSSYRSLMDRSRSTASGPSRMLRLLFATDAAVMSYRDDVSLRVLLSREDQFVARKTLRVWVGSWNINGQEPPPQSELASWLLPKSEERADIYAIGTQEFVQLKAGNILIQSATGTKIVENKESAAPRPEVDGQAEQQKDTEKRLAAWQRDMLKTINGDTDEFTCLAAVQLVGVVLFVFVRRSLQARDVKSTSAAVGTMGLANKGGVATHFTINDSSFAFVAAHLAAGSGHCDRRNQDFRDIMAACRFQGERNELRMLCDHEHVFWCGDLNYRIETPRQECIDMIAAGELQALWQTDQLCRERAAGAVFQGWEEGRLDFAPTYKYDIGTHTWDTSEKQRTPAWCDRVLWLDNSNTGNAGSIHNTSYGRVELLQSDHRPVYAEFGVQVKTVDRSNLLTTVRQVMEETLATQPLGTIAEDEEVDDSAPLSPVKQAASPTEESSGKERDGKEEHDELLLQQLADMLEREPQAVDCSQLQQSLTTMTKLSDPKMMRLQAELKGVNHRLAIPNRRLIRQGPMSLLTPTMSHEMLSKSLLVVCNDVLLHLVRRQGELFFVDSMPLATARFIEVPDMVFFRNVVQIMSQDQLWVLLATSKEEQKSWMMEVATQITKLVCSPISIPITARGVGSGDASRLVQVGNRVLTNDKLEGLQLLVLDGLSLSTIFCHTYPAHIAEYLPAEMGCYANVVIVITSCGDCRAHFIPSVLEQLTRCGATEAFFQAASAGSSFALVCAPDRGAVEVVGPCEGEAVVEACLEVSSSGESYRVSAPHSTGPQQAIGLAAPLNTGLTQPSMLLPTSIRTGENGEQLIIEELRVQYVEEKACYSEDGVLDYCLRVTVDAGDKSFSYQLLKTYPQFVALRNDILNLFPHMPLPELPYEAPKEGQVVRLSQAQIELNGILSATLSRSLLTNGRLLHTTEVAQFFDPTSAAAKAKVQLRMQRKKEREVGHELRLTNFRKPRACDLCQNAIPGLLRQSMLCANCSCVYHIGKCQLAAPPCKQIDQKMIPTIHRSLGAAQYHSFIDRSIRQSSAMCATCHNELAGAPMQKAGMACEYCAMIIHPECEPAALRETEAHPCKMAQCASEIRDRSNGHHWMDGLVEGKMTDSPKCCMCQSKFKSAANTRRCVWCFRMVHAACLQSYTENCDGGPFAKFLLMPGQEDPRKCSAALYTNTPLMYMVESQINPQFLRRLRRELNPAQVFDLEENDLWFALDSAFEIPGFWVAVVGSDELVSEVLSFSLARPSAYRPPILPMPASSSDFVGPMLEWHDEEHTKKFARMLTNISRARCVNVDRWKVQVTGNARRPGTSPSFLGQALVKRMSKQLRPYSMAFTPSPATTEASQDMEPVYFVSQLRFSSHGETPLHLNGAISRISCDGREITLPADVVSLVLANSPLALGGSSSWKAIGNQPVPPCTFDDGQLEILVEIGSATPKKQGGFMKAFGKSSSARVFLLAQGRCARVTVDAQGAEVMMQVDGSTLSTTHLSTNVTVDVMTEGPVSMVQKAR